MLLTSACSDAYANSPSGPGPAPSTRPLELPQLPPWPTPTEGAKPNLASLACGLQTLPVWQHIAANGSYTETQTEAAGGMACRIDRTSCAFNHLVGNLDPLIVYKKEEEPPYNEEDILMHPAMNLPLTRLSQLVQEEWGGAVRLRVTDAYDSLLEHDLNQIDESRKNSLHFEGRAIDLTTYPIDTTNYARLCALAHCAGFDWVHNEGDHCHAAIKADSLCFRCGN